MKLTNTQCKNVKASEKTKKLFDGKGLYLEVTSKGQKYWRMKYRFLGKEKRMAFGVYPEVSLADAREKCMDARRLLDANIDPSLQKKKDKLLVKQSHDNSFEAIARDWHKTREHTWTEKHAKTVMHRLEKDIFPAIGNLPIKDITSPILLTAIKKIEARGAFEPAHRMRSSCGQIFRYGIAMGVCENDPSRPIGEALKPMVKKHYPALKPEEIPEFISALDANRACLTIETRLGMELLMLTMVRTTELIQAKWEEFDLEEAMWTIPAKRMKMRREHLVPLPIQAVAILKELKAMHGFREWILPSSRAPSKHISNNTIRQGIIRLGFKGRMTGHGFRSLAMTTAMEKLSYRFEVPDRQLSHVPKSAVDRAYDRAQFMNERRKMLQDYADYIDECRGNGKVLRMENV